MTTSSRTLRIAVLLLAAALELYDLEEDVSESTNLAGSQPELASMLHEKLESWRQTVGARLPK